MKMLSIETNIVKTCMNLKNVSRNSMKSKTSSDTLKLNNKLLNNLKLVRKETITHCSPNYHLIWKINNKQNTV